MRLQLSLTGLGPNALLRVGVILGLLYSILGLINGDNGKENGNYYKGVM